MTPEALPKMHHAFVEKIVVAVEGDRRLLALLAGGSYVHGGLDQHSDLDFVIIVDDQAYEQVMATRMQFAQGLGDLLAAFTGQHVGEPRLLICLYGPQLLHVDLKFAKATDLDHRVERPAVLFARDPAWVESRLEAAVIAWPASSPEWFEQRAWIWLHYAAAKLGRGELFEAIAMLAFFRDQVLGPMLHRRRGRPQRGVRRIELLGDAESVRLADTVSAHDTAHVSRALLAAIDLYVDLRGDDPPDVPVDGMPAALLHYIEQDARRSGE